MLSLSHGYYTIFFSADILITFDSQEFKRSNSAKVNQCQAELTPLSPGKKISVEKSLHLCKLLSLLHKGILFWQVEEEPNNPKAEMMMRKMRDQKKGCAHFSLFCSAFTHRWKWDTVRRGEDKRWQQSIVSRSVPIRTRRRPDERWKANTGGCHKGGQQSNRETKQKTLSHSWVCVSVHGRLVPEASSLPANPSWEFCSPNCPSNHLVLSLSSALLWAQKHPLHGS